MEEPTSHPPHFRHEHHHSHPHLEGEGRPGPDTPPPPPPFSMNLNLSEGELEEIRLANLSYGYLGGHGNGSEGMSEDEKEFKRELYAVAVPLLLISCLLTILVNLVIVLSARWTRKPMSPTLYFSISLALADAYASLILGTGLIVNSLLPALYGTMNSNLCLQLTLEAFR
jgi:hypothetical protein